MNGTETRAVRSFVIPLTSSTIPRHRRLYQHVPLIPWQVLLLKTLAMESPPKTYPGHELSTLQLLHALHIKLAQGDLLE